MHATMRRLALLGLLCGVACEQKGTPAAVPPATRAAMPPGVASLDVRAQFEQRGIEVVSVEAFPPIGRTGCHEVRRDRVMLANNEHVDVSRFLTPAATEMCLDAYRRQLQAVWPRIADTFVVHGLWMAELSDRLPPPEKLRVQQAINEM
jgi:hypothetical protein